MSTLFVIKIGGNIIDDEKKLDEFLRQFSRIDGKKILVHGGGKLATKLAEQIGIKQQLVDGRRITDAETLKVVTMVYAGYINKNIVAKLQHNGCNAIGITGADGNAVLAHKRVNASIDYGFAGDIDAVNVEFFDDLLQQGADIVVAPITHDGKAQLLNTNADTIAQEIATAMSKKYDVSLLYGFEKAGVLQDANDDATVIPLINAVSFQKLKKENVIFEGMIPKLENAFAAIDKGVRSVIIGRAEELHALVGGKKGTRIVNRET
jgi:acetylglutamate kinase